MAGATTVTAEERAHKRLKSYTDLMWHMATFAIVNGFMWWLDTMKDGGANWAFWITITWGIGLAFHVAAYALDENGFLARRYQRLLTEEQEREADRLGAV